MPDLARPSSGAVEIAVVVAPSGLAMADCEHEKILSCGVAAWNKWRRENPLVRPELSGHTLQHSLRFDMSSTFGLMDSAFGLEDQRERYQALQSGSIYYDSYFRDCWSIQLLRGINFQSADLSRAKLIFADLSEANLSGAVLQGVDLRHTI